MPNTVENKTVRNIAIIAHVDHGKTTLVDHMLRQAGIFRSNESVDERVMDSMDLERERGITISAKNCAVSLGDVKVNILDTPGHADFGGEVERALMMVDGAILLVDASEGPLPQTRFVLSKALEANLKLIVVVNKIDRSDARVAAVLDEVYDLFIDLDANDTQIEFPVIYAIGKDGIAKHSLEEDSGDLRPLFDTILEVVPGPSHDPEKPFQMLVSNLAYSDYLGRLAVGKVYSGSVKSREPLVCIGADGKISPLKVSSLQAYQGLSLAEVTEAQAGDIVLLAGAENVEIGDTICRKESPVALPRISVDEPTIGMKFQTNNSPLTGLEGEFVQSRKLRERLLKETQHNVALQVEDGESADEFLVKGRGEFQMAILIEQMRREGFELAVGRPQILFRQDGERQLEPIEQVFIDCDENYVGVITEKLSLRKGRMTNLVNHGSGRVRLEFEVPSRGLVGYRGEFLTDTRGTGLMNSLLSGYEEFKGEIKSRTTGSLVADRPGDAVAYGLFNLEPRGTLFITAGETVYKGMIIGEHNRESDLHVNATKAKKLSNMRASGKDEHVILAPVQPMTIEKAIEYIKDDELVEITPKNIRLRKATL